MNNTKNKLEWTTIYYHKELTTDNRILYIESTQEAKYRDGYLIKHTFADSDNKSQSVTFVPGTEVQWSVDKIWEA